MLRDGIKNKQYSDFVYVAGNKSKPVWSLARGSLPPGLALDSKTGKISGIPVQAGVYAFTIGVTGSYVERNLSIKVAGTEKPGECQDGQARACGAGVCARVNETCANGAWSGCDLGSIAGYELREAKCSDGLDNDCDGLADRNDTDCHVNHAPSLQQAGNRTVNEGYVLAFKLNATDQDGDAVAFSASGMPPGALLAQYSGAFSWRPSYLQAGKYTVTVTASDGKLSNSTRFRIDVLDSSPPGDVNGDNVVDIKDFMLMREAFGTRTGSAKFNTKADFNHDGVVNIVDMIMAARKYGTGVYAGG